VAYDLHTNPTFTRRVFENNPDIGITSINSINPQMPPQHQKIETLIPAPIMPNPNQFQILNVM
jgi:hypothetical protein